MALPLPVPHVTARRAAFLLINAFLIEMAQRVLILGGGTMLSPLPVVDDDNHTWGEKLVAYLIELEGRVTGAQGAVGSGGGGGLSSLYGVGSTLYGIGGGLYGNAE